jgi:hypothetical protein
MSDLKNILWTNATSGPELTPLADSLPTRGSHPWILRGVKSDNFISSRNLSSALKGRLQV